MQRCISFRYYDKSVVQPIFGPNDAHLLVAALILAPLLIRSMATLQCHFRLNGASPVSRLHTASFSHHDLRYILFSRKSIFGEKAPLSVAMGAFSDFLDFLAHLWIWLPRLARPGFPSLSISSRPPYHANANVSVSLKYFLLPYLWPLIYYFLFTIYFTCFTASLQQGELVMCSPTVTSIDSGTTVGLITSVAIPMFPLLAAICRAVHPLAIMTV